MRENGRGSSGRKDGVGATETWGVKGEPSLASPPLEGAGWRETVWADFFERDFELRTPGPTAPREGAGAGRVGPEARRGWGGGLPGHGAWDRRRGIGRGRGHWGCWRGVERGPRAQ